MLKSSKSRWIPLSIALTVVLSLFLWTVDASARAGGGSSSGSRGSRSYSAPARPSESSSSPSRPAAPSSFQQPTPQRSGLMSGLMGGLGGLILGGLIGSMLFGGLGHGLFGGIGLFEILIVGGLVVFGLMYFKRRQAAAPPGYASPGGPAEATTWRPEPMARSTALIDPPAAPSDLDRGLGHLRQMDASFDPARFADTASDVFFKVQAAWMGRDMATVRDFLTPEMYATLQQDCDRLRADRRVNRLESIAVRTVQVTEAWQESGRDFVTVAFLASLLDYTTDESGTQVVAGSRTEPVKFEEYWTFARPVGPNAWKLSAIQQPQ
jgi:predicted lipid-binding transport protein (Tim44 family)